MGFYSYGCKVIELAQWAPMFVIIVQDELPVHFSVW